MLSRRCHCYIAIQVGALHSGPHPGQTIQCRWCRVTIGIPGPYFDDADLRMYFGQECWAGWCGTAMVTDFDNIGLKIRSSINHTAFCIGLSFSAGNAIQTASFYGLDTKDKGSADSWVQTVTSSVHRIQEGNQTPDQAVTVLLNQTSSPPFFSSFLWKVNHISILPILHTLIKCHCAFNLLG